MATINNEASHEIDRKHCMACQYWECSRKITFPHGASRPTISVEVSNANNAACAVSNGKRGVSQTCSKWKQWVSL